MGRDNHGNNHPQELGQQTDAAGCGPFRDGKPADRQVYDREEIDLQGGNTLNRLSRFGDGRKAQPLYLHDDINHCKYHDDDPSVTIYFYLQLGSFRCHNIFLFFK